VRSEPATPGGQQRQAGQRRRTRQSDVKRDRRIAIAVDEHEHDLLACAAREEGLTVSAYVADRALAAARGAPSGSAAPLREALATLVAATVQVQKAGTNLNQAVAALNATGQPPGNLIPYARYTTSVIRRLDETAARVARLLP
jgi:hypothetical protein